MRGKHPDWLLEELGGELALVSDFVLAKELGQSVETIRDLTILERTALQNYLAALRHLDEQRRRRK